MHRTIRIILAAASVLLLFAAATVSRAQTITVTNASGGIDHYILAPQSATGVTIPLTASTSVTGIVASVPQGATKVATDGYAFFKSLSLTNPISVGVFGLQNGARNYGAGLEVNAVNPNSLVNAGFALAAIQTTDATGRRKWDFYDATINLSVSTIETIPVLNLPMILRVFSGPFASLNGGVLIGEQSGVTGDLNIPVGPKTADPSSQKYLDFGGGVVNCAGAAAAGLKPAMPMAHVNFTFKFGKGNGFLGI